MKEAEEKVKSAEPGTQIIAARVVDIEEPSVVVSSVKVTLLIGSLDGRILWMDSVVSDASGLIVFRIPNELSDGYLSWRVEDKQFVGSRQYLSVAHLSGAWKIPIKVQR